MMPEDDGAFLDALDAPEPERPERKAPTIAELRTMTVVDIETAGRCLGVGRDAAYALARQGVIPTLSLGRRKVCPAPRLLALLGAAEA